MVLHIPATAGASAFSCPSCGVHASQDVGDLAFQPRGQFYRTSAHVLDGYTINLCSHCFKHSIWRDDVMLFPNASTAPMCHPDMPPEIIADFEEARMIVAHSPRGAAALLRLVIQKLCAVLGQPGENINADIGKLVALGLPVSVQRAFDSVRVFGNEAVHPGVLDLRDDPALAQTLFKLVNLIVEKTISEPKEVDAIYSSLPQDKLGGIIRRDT